MQREIRELLDFKDWPSIRFWLDLHRRALHKHLDLYGQTKDRFHYYMAMNYLETFAHLSTTIVKLKGWKYSWEK